MKSVKFITGMLGAAVIVVAQGSFAQRVPAQEHMKKEVQAELDKWPPVIKCTSITEDTNYRFQVYLQSVIFNLSQVRLTYSLRTGLTPGSVVIYQQAGPVASNLVFNAIDKTVLGAIGNNLPEWHNCTTGKTLSDIERGW